jgi:hypothetical protein
MRYTHPFEIELFTKAALISLRVYPTGYLDGGFIGLGCDVDPEIQVQSTTLSTHVVSRVSHGQGSE